MLVIAPIIVKWTQPRPPVNSRLMHDSYWQSIKIKGEKKHLMNMASPGRTPFVIYRKGTKASCIARHNIDRQPWKISCGEIVMANIWGKKKMSVSLFKGTMCFTPPVSLQGFGERELSNEEWEDIWRHANSISAVPKKWSLRLYTVCTYHPTIDFTLTWFLCLKRQREIAAQIHCFWSCCNGSMC